MDFSHLYHLYYEFTDASLHTKLRAFPKSDVTVSLHYMPRCLRLTVTCGQTPTTVASSKPLQICCQASQLTLAGKGVDTSSHHCITPEQ